MNRLIILGNGFDLAHGLKTRYSDFILDLVKTEVKKSFSEGVMDDYGNKSTYTNDIFTVLRKKANIRIDREVERELQEIENIKELKSFLDRMNISIYRSKIFSQTFSKLSSLNWADLEAEYYDILIGTIENSNPRKLHASYMGEIVKLNEELDFFKDRLVQYLKKVEAQRVEVPPELVQSFWSRALGREEGLLAKNIHFLNFNYTNTLARYGEWHDLEQARGIAIEINNIHGQLSNEESIIFGYGDEVDSYYKKLENFNENELLRHVKSFGYFKYNNYKRLLRFLDSREFEVWIVGHSCGLSDRVMLKKIFEHPQCRSIKIHHYWDGDSNDFTEKAFQISRHFDDKELMRERIKSFAPKDCISEWIGKDFFYEVETRIRN